MVSRRAQRGVALALAVSLNASPASAALQQAVAACKALTDPALRLACYDRAAGAPRFVGRLSGMTDAFDVSPGTVLRFESDDAIMVVYLLAESGAVVQNLHQAGAGTGRFTIEEGGRFRLQVNASGNWRIWLDEND